MPTPARAVLVLLFALLVVAGAAAFLAYSAHANAQHSRAEARSADLLMRQRLERTAETVDQRLAGGFASVRASAEREAMSLRAELEELREAVRAMRGDLAVVARDASAAAVGADGHAAELAGVRADVAALAREVRANPSGLRTLLAALARAGLATPATLEDRR